MAGMCCGIVGGDSDQKLVDPPAGLGVRRRRMEVRQQMKLMADIKPAAKKQKLSSRHVVRQLLRDCQNATHNSALPVASIDASVANDAPPAENPVAKFGFTSVRGRRRDMEDAVSMRPGFISGNANANANGRSGGLQPHEFHFYGVFDGHGCSHVAMKCKSRMHEIIKEEIEMMSETTTTTTGTTAGSIDWKGVMERSFMRMDKEASTRSSTNNVLTSTSCRCELQTPQCDAVGSTAVVAIVTPDEIVVSNCGDSRAVLCRGGVAVPLSSDHKPDRPDELDRIESAGGRVIYWDGPRVLGVLAMSRAIGDNYLKPYVIPDPEVTVTPRTGKEECLILASDGLWDVVTNQTAAGVARMCLQGMDRTSSQVAGGESSDKACLDASLLLTRLALARHSTDNISVAVADLRSTRGL